jgi:Na+/H+ antiporter NhaC
MVVACSLGCVAAALSAVGRVREQALGVVFVEGMMRLFVPSLILIGAWALSGTLKGLETPRFLSQLLGDWLAVGFLPVLVFGVAALVAFSTGTSWGTMGIMMPLAIPVALVMGEQDLVLVSAVVGAVFSGAVFGDHASPLSDTTIVSAVACGVDPMDHVRTQLPYALIAAGVAALVGFLPTGWGLSPWVGLAVGAGILVLLVVSGKRVVGER